MPLLLSQAGLLGVGAVEAELVLGQALAAGTGGSVAAALTGVAVFDLAFALGSVFVGVAVSGFRQLAAFICVSPGAA